jgi:hypothetical protein
MDSPAAGTQLAGWLLQIFKLAVLLWFAVGMADTGQEKANQDDSRLATIRKPPKD